MAYIYKKNYNIYNDLPAETDKSDYLYCHDLAAEAVVLMLKKGYDVVNVKMCGLYTDILCGKYQLSPSETTHNQKKDMRIHVYETWLPVSPPNYIDFEFSKAYDMDYQVDCFNEECLEYNIGCESHMVKDRMHLFIYCHDMTNNSRQRLLCILKMMDLLCKYIKKWEKV